MIQQYLSDWSLMRLMRLGMGIFAGVQSYQMQDYFLGILSAMFLLQAYTNTGCCGTQGCTVPATKPTPSQKHEINSINQ